MRKLTPEEQKLWDSVMDGTVQIRPSETHSGRPRKSFAPIQDGTFDTTLDLHHMTLKQAHEESQKHIERADTLSVKKILHITGKSGPISSEFETWVQLNPLVRRIQKLNDGGAWKLWLRKK